MERYGNEFTDTTSPRNALRSAINVVLDEFFLFRVLVRSCIWDLGLATTMFALDHVVASAGDLPLSLMVIGVDRMEMVNITCSGRVANVQKDHETDSEK